MTRGRNLRCVVESILFVCSDDASNHLAFPPTRGIDLKKIPVILSRPARKDIVRNHARPLIPARASLASTEPMIRCRPASRASGASFPSG